MHRLTRRAALGAFVGLVLASRRAAASPLPLALQAELLASVASYDKGLAARAGGTVRVLIVEKAAEDALWASKLKAALDGIEQIAGLRHVQTIATLTSGAELAARIKAERTAIVVLPDSLTASDADDVKRSLDQVDVLSVAPSADLVRRGVVLGFELVAGKAKLFFNLSQAARQRVRMSADAMKVMTVFE